MQLIIISGKIGSGKSTLSKCFQKKDYHYISSDIVAKNIIQNNRNIIDKLNKELYKPEPILTGVQRKVLEEVQELVVLGRVDTLMRRRRS